MNAITSLATSALLGTERRPPDWPSPEGPLGELLVKIPRDQTERTLLQTAGVLATCHLAGWLPQVEPDTTPAASADALSMETTPEELQTLSSILTDGPTRLQAESFQKLAAAHRALPHRLLPKALDAGRQSVALRALLLPVLGQRGCWLAAQNESWVYAAGGGSDTLDEEAWLLGSLDQRRLYLTALRNHDAAKARDLIVTVCTNEGARERTAFIECLSTSLSLDDQEVLEALLTDKSKEARQTAARLLASLPESRYMQRMAARLQPCLSVEKKFLRGTQITLEPPAAYASEWKADLIEEAKPKGLSMGERAWWLLQMVRATPLTWWEAQTFLSPKELIQWAQQSDWSEALLQGWATAQAQQQKVEWAEAFLSMPIPPSASLNALDLVLTLPLPLRENHFLTLFKTLDIKQTGSISLLLDRFIGSLPLDAPPLTFDPAKALLQTLKHHVNSGHVRYDWQLRTTLAELACVLPSALFADASTGWDITKEEVQPFAEAIARMGLILDHRQKLLHFNP